MEVVWNHQLATLNILDYSLNVIAEVREPIERRYFRLGSIEREERDPFTPQKSIGAKPYARSDTDRARGSHCHFSHTSPRVWRKRSTNKWQTHHGAYEPDRITWR